MSRNTIAIAILLALLTGGVVGRLVAVGSPILAPRAISSERNLDLVRSFYDGMNAYLDSGDATFLSLLAPGFQDAGVLSTEPGSTESLVARLDALRASAAIPRFEIEEIHDLGQVIQVRLSTGLPAQLEAGGFTISGFEIAGALEFLHVQGDAIVARWGQDDLIPRIAVLMTEPFSTGPPPAQKLKGDRIAIGGGAALAIEVDFVTLERGAEWRSATTGASLLIVERGSLAVGLGSDVEILTEREGRSSAGGLQRISNRAESSSSFWLVSIKNDFPPSPIIATGQLPELAGVTIERRAWLPFFVLPPDLGSIQIELARIVAPPGVNLDPDSDLGHQLIVIDGSVDATVHRGELLHVNESGLGVIVRDRVSMASNTAAAALPGASATYQVAGPGSADLLLLTIARID